MYNHFAITVTTAQNSGMIGFEWGDQLPRREKTTLTATAMVTQTDLSTLFLLKYVTLLVGGMKSDTLESSVS